jgi:hypothetical protein
MKQFSLLLLLWCMMACKNSPETNAEGDRLHLVVNTGSIQNDRWEKIAAPMTWWINIHGDEELYRKVSKDFTREQLMSFVAHTYLNDVVKEGHQWFFSNTAGIIRNDVLDGLKAVGLQKHAEIYQQALQKFTQTKDLEADFTEEDTGIILLQENENVEDLFRAYAKANASKFYYDQWVNKPD